MSTNLQVGIVGLPNVGKSTLFNAITKAGAEAANYPFCTIEPNVGVVDLPDARLDTLVEMFRTKSRVPAAMRFVDIAGLVAGASKGEGLGNQFLAHIRETDAIAQVVRCFEDDNITHVAGSVDPLRDIEIILTELCLADLDTVDKRKKRVEKLAKSGNKEAKTEMALIEKIEGFLAAGKPARLATVSEEEMPFLREWNLLTVKPVLYVVNVGEDEIHEPEQNPHVQAVAALAEREGAQWVPVSAAIEAEIAELPAEEAQAFLSELGLTESGLDRLIKAAYSLLGLINFFTAGEQECRAWTIVEGTKAPQAAGKIHSDMERGFIRAEIVSYDDLIACGNMAKAREKGLIRLEGKDYVMKDGDVTYFRFNV